MTLLDYPRIEEYGQTPPPNTAKGLALSAFRPFAESAYFMNKASHWALGTPLDENMRASIDLINYQLNNQDITGGQRVGNAVASIAGTLLDPITLGFAGVGAKVFGKGVKMSLGIFPDIMGGLSEGMISKETIDAIIKAEVPIFSQNKFAKYLPKSYSESLERIGESGGAFAGFDVPTAFNENYNADTDRLDYGGMAKSIAINSGIGMSFPPILWAMGLISGKIDKAAVEVEGAAAQIGKKIPVTKKVTPVEAANKAFEGGHISPEEHEFYTKFHVEPSDKTGHLQRARAILDKENHPVNALTGNVEFEFLTGDEMKQLQIFATDQMSSNLTGDAKTAMTNFVAHNALDRMTNMLHENPSMMEGMRGYLDNLIARLERKTESLAKADEYITKNMRRAEERKMPISQMRLMKMMERGNLSEKEMPFVIPENISGMRSRISKINDAEVKYMNYKKEFERTNKMKFKKKADKAEKKIKDLRKEMDEYVKTHELKSQAKELDAIEEHLLSARGLPENYHQDKQYMRLMDLAHFSSRARGMLERVKLRENYEQQQAIHDVMRAIMDIADAGMTNVAKPEKVIDYLKERIETNLDLKATIEHMDEKVSDIESASREPLAAREESIDTQVREMNESETLSSEEKQEINTLHEKLKQFEGSEEARAELINCIMGAADVSI